MKDFKAGKHPKLKKELLKYRDKNHMMLNLFSLNRSPSKFTAIATLTWSVLAQGQRWTSKFEAQTHTRYEGWMLH